MVDPARERWREGQSESVVQDQWDTAAGASAWGGTEWWDGVDEKTRRVKSGLRLLADGISGRVAIRRPGKQHEAEVQEAHWYNRVWALKGFGNAIVPQVAAEFIQAFGEAW